MTSINRIALATATTFVLIAAGNAQEAATKGTAVMPDACPAGPSVGHDMAPPAGDLSGHQAALMQGMVVTIGQMMQGIMADDADVAFACGMIPHHQAAINMAEAELEYGDDSEMKEMARTIIEAQSKEIKQLTDWIEEYAQ